ncbi:MAG: hypothetical protein J1F23_03050, partial [Oscillospiraceae bacterium]|nr:hypothetical protein [Oscillospiraceae bacterium]
MPSRNGILTTLRAKGRTVLFTLLIFVLTVALTLGVGMWAYCAQLLTRFNETYTSIVLAEYMGEDYPDENAADEQARQASSALNDAAISAVDGVELWERTDSTLVNMAGYKLAGADVPYSDCGVIVVSNLSPRENGFLGRIDQVLYTREGKDNVFGLFDLSDTDLSLSADYGKKYLVHGRFVHISSNRTFVVTGFYEGCETKPWLELSGDDDPALTDSLFVQTADYYRTANNTATLTSSDNIAALEPFQQGTLYLEDGRFPMSGESGVCLLSGNTAEQTGIGVGDTVDISLLISDSENRYDLTKTDDNRTLEVVGVTNKQADYAGVIWVSKAEGGFSSPLFGYGLGRAVLDNDFAVQAAAKLEELMPPQVRMTLYDQGYSAAAQPIQALRSTAMVVTAATALGALAVLFLFAYLFVGRQRETVHVMTSLGTPVGKIRVWLLSGASLIAFAASAVGAVVGHLSLNGVTAFALLIAKKLYAVDTRYSNAALGVIRDAPKAGGISIWYSVLVCAAVFIVALILCLIFLHQARRADTLKKGKTAVRVPKGKTSLFGRGAARFALLSAKRGGWRSGIVPAVALVLTIMIGILTVETSGWSKQLDELYENSRLEGQVVSLNGRSAANIDISAPSARKLWKSGLLSDISVSLNWNYWLEEEMPPFGDNAFGDEAREGWIDSQPVLAAANSLDAIPEFYYTDRPEIRWLEGWGENFFEDTELQPVYSAFRSYGEMSPYPVVAGNAFLEKRGLQLGDETYIMLRTTHHYMIPQGYYSWKREFPLPIKIVGSFQQMGQKANLYAPLSFWCDPAWITGETDIMEENEPLPSTIYTQENFEKLYYGTTTFQTCRFTLNSAYDLESLKTFLSDNSYSQVGKVERNRTTVLLKDQEFTETLGGLRRYIAFSNILLPVLFLAVALIGFIISWLMINGRRMEFAVLRGIGASRRRVFATFFLEQAALC